MSRSCLTSLHILPVFLIRNNQTTLAMFTLRSPQTPSKAFHIFSMALPEEIGLLSENLRSLVASNGRTLPTCELRTLLLSMGCLFPTDGILLRIIYQITWGKHVALPTSVIVMPN